jgi:hypothetical protein
MRKRHENACGVTLAPRPGEGGTPRRLPRQRNATQFVSGESVKICPLTGDLTYGLSPTNSSLPPIASGRLARF